MRTRTIFVFLHMSFRINLDTPPEHPFCSDGFFARRSLIQKALVLRAQNIACRYGLAGWRDCSLRRTAIGKWAASPARAGSPSAKALALGGHVRKGEKCTTVVYADPSALWLAPAAGPRVAGDPELMLAA